MRNVRYISIHCTDTQNPDHDNLKTVKEWHTSPPPQGRGWKDIGYHFFIRSNGTIEVGRPIWEIPAAVEGHNTGMVAIALHGQNHFTVKQLDSAAKLCVMLMKILNINLHDILPHNFWNKDKTCPNFDVKLITLRILDMIGTVNSP